MDFLERGIMLSRHASINRGVVAGSFTSVQVRAKLPREGRPDRASTIAGGAGDARRERLDRIPRLTQQKGGRATRATTTYSTHKPALSAVGLDGRSHFRGRPGRGGGGAGGSALSPAPGPAGVGVGVGAGAAAEGVAGSLVGQSGGLEGKGASAQSKMAGHECERRSGRERDKKGGELLGSIVKYVGTILWYIRRFISGESGQSNFVPQPSSSKGTRPKDARVLVAALRRWMTTHSSAQATTLLCTRATRQSHPFSGSSAPHRTWC